MRQQRRGLSYFIDRVAVHSRGLLVLGRSVLLTKGAGSGRFPKGEFDQVKIHTRPAQRNFWKRRA